MITAIFTDASNTALTIEASEALSLVQMGSEGQPIDLKQGVNNVVVGPGMFKILSRNVVRVTSTTPSPKLYIASTTNDKDPDFPDSPKFSSVNTNQATIHQFFVDVRSQPAPQ